MLDALQRDFEGDAGPRSQFENDVSPSSPREVPTFPAELVPSTVPAIPFEAGRRFPSFVPTAADEDSDDSDQCGPEVVSDPEDTENLENKIWILQSKCSRMGFVRCESSAPRRLRKRMGRESQATTAVGVDALGCSSREVRVERIGNQVVADGSRCWQQMSMMICPRQLRSVG